MIRKEHDPPLQVNVQGDFDKALRYWLRTIAPVILDVKRRQRFWPRPTRNRRRRTGKMLERRRQTSLAKARE